MSETLKRIIEQQAKTSATIRTMSYHDFLENNSHPTKEEIAKAKHNLCCFNAKKWVSVAVLKPLAEAEEAKQRNLRDKIDHLEKEKETLKKNMMDVFSGKVGAPSISSGYIESCNEQLRMIDCQLVLLKEVFDETFSAKRLLEGSKGKKETV